MFIRNSAPSTKLVLKKTSISPSTLEALTNVFHNDKFMLIKRRLNITGMGIALAVLAMPLMLLSSPLSAAGSVDKIAASFAGAWVLNLEETDLLREELDEKPTLIQGPGRVQVSVMGLPIPTGRSKLSSQSPLSATDPAVLRSKTLAITIKADTVLMQYSELSGTDAKEIVRRGHYRGRDSKWSTKKITQKYKTTERKVTKTWSIRSDKRLLAVVTIKNPGSKKRTFSRVFDRAQ
jgi:hypothetical protein